MRTIREKAFVVLDGTPPSIDRIAADTPCHSGKHERHGMDVRVLTDPLGRLLRAPSAPPGSAHDPTASRQRAITEALTEAGVERRADKAHQSVGGPALQAVADEHEDVVHTAVLDLGEYVHPGFGTPAVAAHVPGSPAGLRQ
ncbi:hypothetical protein [Streptomyces sp. NPDC012825]|uniref:hypothetical protein n=1 Tax=Streptomyces sp. NPDC012825 TaxID=3364851 RepID=UPI0036C1652C